MSPKSKQTTDIEGKGGRNKKSISQPSGMLTGLVAIAQGIVATKTHLEKIKRNDNSISSL